MSVIAHGRQYAGLCNDPLPATVATRHAVGSLGRTYLADTPKALSESCAFLYGMGFTPYRKG
jgi:hypothetical protein